MATIQQEILNAFFRELTASEEFTEELVTEVRKLFDADKKLNATDLARVLSCDSKDDLT